MIKLYKYIENKHLSQNKCTVVTMTVFCITDHKLYAIQKIVEFIPLKFNIFDTILNLLNKID